MTLAQTPAAKPAPPWDLQRVHRTLFLAVAASVTAASVAGVTLPNETQVAVLAVLVALLGVPHGALDAHVARASLGVRGPARLALYLLGYIGLAGAVVALWLMAPMASLLAFLVISALHFSFDWSGQTGVLGRLGFGFSVVCLPALLFEAEVEALFAILTGLGGVPGPSEPLTSEPLTSELLTGGSLVAGMSMLAYPALVAMIWGAARARRWPGLLALEAGALLVMALTLSPLIYFTIYFCGLHSPRHLMDTCQGLGIRTWRQLLVMAAPATLATLAAAWVIGFQGVDLAPSEATVRILFIGLAALTVPHMITVGLGSLRSRPAALSRDDRGAVPAAGATGAG